MNINPGIAQAKAALNKNLAVTQSKLARTAAERDQALAQIQAAVDRAEMAERSARDMAREQERLRVEVRHLRIDNARLRDEAFMRAAMVPPAHQLPKEK